MAAAPSLPLPRRQQQEQQYAVGDVCMVDPASGCDEPACPGRDDSSILALSEDSVSARVSYYGWSEMWDADVPLASLRPPSRDCAQLMAEVDALQGMLLVPSTGHVRHIGDPATVMRQIAVGRVVDRAVRQPQEDAPMQVMFYLEHVGQKGATSYPDGWVAADKLQTWSRLSTGCCLEVDTSECMEKETVLRMRMEEDELWICMTDYVKFVTRGKVKSLSKVQWPATLEAVLRKQKIVAHGNPVLAFPASVLPSVLRCLPIEHARRHRQSGDLEWFRSSIAAELSAIGMARVLTPKAVALPLRKESILCPPEAGATIEVHLRQGLQPLIAGVDFFRLVARRKKRQSVEMGRLIDQWYRQHSDIPWHDDSDDGKLLLPADILTIALDRLAEEVETTPFGLKTSHVVAFRSSSVWRWLRNELAELTDAGALRTPGAVTAREVALQSAGCADSASYRGWERVEWSEVEAERGLQRVMHCEWSEAALNALPKRRMAGQTEAKYIIAPHEPSWVRNGIDLKQVEAALDPNSDHSMAELVDIGRITDPEHPAKKHLQDQSSAFGLFARAEILQPFTVIGEYTGIVHTDSELEEAQRKLDAAGGIDNYSNVMYKDRKGVKETLTICTVGQSNELILANDWRENVMEPKQEDDCSKTSKQNLLPVEVISTVDNKPHILYVIGEEPVKRGTELLQDYGDDYWQSFRNTAKWTKRLLEAKKALARERQLRLAAERRVQELKRGRSKVARKPLGKCDRKALSTVSGEEHLTHGIQQHRQVQNVEGVDTEEQSLMRTFGMQDSNPRRANRNRSKSGESAELATVAPATTTAAIAGAPNEQELPPAAEKAQQIMGENHGLEQDPGTENDVLDVDDDDVEIVAEKGCANFNSAGDMGLKPEQAIELDGLGAVCVHLTGYVSYTKKIAHRSILQRLGVKLVDDPECGDWTWMRKVTHVVAPAGMRNCKTIAALATQRWLLKDSWVEACAKAQELVAEAAYGDRRGAATLSDTSFFFESSYRKQYDNSIHKMASLSKLIQFCGGMVVYMGRSDYVLVGDEHDAARSAGAKLLTLDAFLCLAAGATAGANRDTGDEGLQLHLPTDPVQISQDGLESQLTTTISPVLRDFSSGASKPGTQPTGSSIVKQQKPNLIKHLSTNQPAKRKKTADVVQRQPDTINEVKRMRAADIDHAAEIAKSVTAFASSKEGSSGRWRFDKHDLIDNHVQHRLLGHKKHSEGQRKQHITQDSRQNKHTIAENMRGGTYLLQPDVEILQARVFGASNTQPGGGTIMLLVDKTGVFTVSENTVQKKLTESSALLESEDIAAVFDESTESWDPAWAQLDQEMNGSDNLRRLSTDSSASNATTDSDGSDGDLSVSPTTSVESHHGKELAYEGIEVGCYIRRKFNIGTSSMPKLFTGQLIKRCGGGSDWCFACKTVLVPGCAQHRVLYTDGDQEDFNLLLQEDMRKLQALVVPDTAVDATEKAQISSWAERHRSDALNLRKS